jgi:Protein of unknown function (DUF3800)
MSLIVYLDEVGNPTLEDTDKDFPLFAIALFICDADCYRDAICPRVLKLKFDWFGHEGVILHSRDIRKAQGDFGILTDPDTRARFLADLTSVMEQCDYQLIAVAVRKDRHKARYRYPADPYDLALMFALERLVSVLEGAKQAEVMIIAERRGTREDRELYTAFQRVVSAGTEFIDGSRFRRIAFRMAFVPKTMNVVGTQMADLVAYPIARFVLDPKRANRAYDSIRGKLCRQLKIFP